MQKNEENYDFKQESLALLKLLIVAEKSIENGCLTLDEAFSDIPKPPSINY